jgi:cytochrome c oxidase subunit 4
MAETETETPFEEELGAEGMPDPRETAAPHRRHPSAKEYVRIGLILAALTGIEVWLSYSDIPHGVLVALLLSAAVVKFALVVLWFMHLRFDDRRYARFFVMGIAGAGTLYLIVLLLFGVFSR